jgi:hypothetical protein
MFEIELTDNDRQRLRLNNISEFWQFFKHPQSEAIKNAALSIYMGSRMSIGEAILTAIRDHNLRLSRTRLVD